MTKFYKVLLLILSCALCMLVPRPCHAQYPHVLSYTGVLSDSIGRPLKGIRTISFVLVDNSNRPHPSGWLHRESVVLNGGMIYSRLGDTTSGSNKPFPELNGEYFLSITVSVEPQPLPRVALSASPYSLFALEIADNVVTEKKIISGAVSTDKVRDANITEPKLADNAVSNRTLQANAVSSSNIQNGAITATKIAQGAVSSSAILDGAITDTKLAVGSVNSEAIQNGAIQNTHLSPGSVTDVSLADNSVANRHLQDYSVGTNKLQDRSITNSKIGNREVGIGKIAANAVGSTELTDGIELRYLNMKKDGDNSNLIHAFLGDLYATSSGQYQGYGFLIFGKDGVPSTGWNSNQAVCGFRTDGAVFGTSKPFIVPDPTNSSRKIQYTAIEGPEAAMYVRGTAELVNGSATISLPPHFKAMAVDTGITVNVTPTSASSLGLSVTSVSPTSFTVKELQNGNGSYKFSFIVYAVRKGYENYKVYLYSNYEQMTPPLHKENDR